MESRQLLPLLENYDRTIEPIAECVRYERSGIHEFILTFYKEGPSSFHKLAIVGETNSPPYNQEQPPLVLSENTSSYGRKFTVCHK